MKSSNDEKLKCFEAAKDKIDKAAAMLEEAEVELVEALKGNDDNFDYTTLGYAHERAREFLEELDDVDLDNFE